MLGKLPVVLVLVVVCLAGCGGSDSSSSNPPSPPAISVSVTPQPAFVGSGQSIPFAAMVTNDTSGVTWSVNGTPGGSSTVGTIDANGNFTAPPVTQNATATITATSKKDTTKSGTATATVIAPGVVAATANAQVASYTITVPDGLNVLVQFGPDTNYGLVTAAPLAPSGGGSVTILVAGMRANTAYHMRAVFQSNSQSVFTDADQTFTTTSYPVANLPLISAAAATGMTPQSGVELLNLLSTSASSKLNVLATDLSGNVIWAYDPGTSIPAGDIPQPTKLLPNGHFLINFSASSGTDGQNSVLREIDLAGTTIWELTATDLNAKLATATCAGCNVTVVGTHHDFALLPNGHVIVIAAEQLAESGLLGQPSPITVTGDILIDLDQNHNPVWVWSTFDHLDLNRHLAGLPDWTHSNAIVYSASDHNLIMSMRHQSWVIKIDYNDGQGTGNILWKLGYQGDFTLQNTVQPVNDPLDWFSFQHDANVISDNSSGVFQLLLFDNGNQHVINTSGTLCGGATPCTSRVPILQLDETAKTATIQWVNDLAPVFSFFGGSARLLANGNVEFDECATTTPANNAAIFEVTKTTPPQQVWQMQISGQYAYRGFRIPSLYPGVQW